MSIIDADDGPGRSVTNPVFGKTDEILQYCNTLPSKDLCGFILLVSSTRSPLIYNLRVAALQMNCWLMVHQGSMHTVFTVQEWKEKFFFILQFCLVHLMFVHIIHNKSQFIFIYLNWCQKSLPSIRGWLLILFYIHDWSDPFLHAWFDYQSRWDVWFQTIMLIVSCPFWPFNATACLYTSTFLTETLLFWQIQL